MGIYRLFSFTAYWILFLWFSIRTSTSMVLLNESNYDKVDLCYFVKERCLNPWVQNEKQQIDKLISLLHLIYCILSAFRLTYTTFRLQIYHKSYLDFFSEVLLFSIFTFNSIFFIQSNYLKYARFIRKTHYTKLLFKNISYPCVI